MSEDSTIIAQQSELQTPVAVVVPSDVVVADGEYHQLIQSLEEDEDVSIATPPLTFENSSLSPSIDGVLKSKINYDNAESWYGNPLSIEEAREQMSDDNINNNYSSHSSNGSTCTNAGNGLLWNITIIPNEMLKSTTTSNGSSASTSTSIKRSHGLNHRDFTVSKLSSFSSSEQQPQQQASELAGNTIQIKPRRPSLPVSANDFVSSLTTLEYDISSDGSSLPTSTKVSRQPRYIFHGILNGWPGLRTLELISLEYRRNTSNVIPSPRELLSGQLLWVKAWSINDTISTTSSPSKATNDNTISSSTVKIDDLKAKSAADRSTVSGTTSINAPIPLQPNRVYRATVRGPKWSAIGWSPDSPGFCFWYETQRPTPLVPTKVSYGTRMIQELCHRDHLCTNIHMISHRYAVNRIETPRDRLTYHSICLLEWDHGLYCTLVETAYLNGMGGYKCRSNWYDDKDAEPMNQLYRDFPSEMVCPWRMTQSEIRCYDVPAKNLNEFRAYMMQYNESAPAAQRRFIDVRYTFSHPARLTFRSKVHIAQYLLNYILRDSTYGDLNRNCQTFAADFCSFVAGKKGVAPFHPVNRIEYQNRTHMFLYDSHLYEKKRNTKK
jgi:hypothetical protein